MKTSNLVQVLSIIALVCAPFVYAAFIWDALPDRVPTHFGISGKPDAYGSKISALIPVVILMVVGLGVYFLITNIEKVDPKRAKQASKDTFGKIAMLTLMLMSGVSLYIVHSTLHSATGNFLFVLMGLFFAAMGNLMHSVQPNYFVGLRLPWTLANDENWRKTHQLAGKLWFGGGLLIAVVSLFLSPQFSIIFMLCAITIMVVIPTVFSYRMFKKTPPSV